VLLECCCIQIEHSKWENWNHIFFCKVSFSIDLHCQCLCVRNSMTLCYYIDISWTKDRFERPGRHWIIIWCSSVKVHVVLRGRFFKQLGTFVVVIVWYLILQIPVQSLSITTKVVSSNPVHGDVYSIQHYVIKFVSDLRQVGGFLWILWFPPPI